MPARSAVSFTRLALLLGLVAAGYLAARLQPSFATRVVFYVLVGVGAYAVAVLASARQVRLKREIWPRRLSAGGSIEVSLEVVVEGSFPLFWLVVSDGLPPGLEKKARAHRVIFFPGARGQRQWRYQVRDLPRGVFAWDSARAGVWDLFGLVRREQVYSLPDKVVVYPALVPVAGHVGGRGVRPYRSRVQALMGEVREVSGVREYQPGDRLHQIHWLATARTGSLKTKELPLSAVSEMVLLLDSGAGHEPALFEPAASLAASLAAYALDRGWQARLAILGRGERVVQAPSRQYLPRLLYLLATASPEKEAFFGPLAARKLNHLLPGAVAVLITYRPWPELLEATGNAKRRRVEIEMFLVGSHKYGASGEATLTGLQRLGVPVQRLGTLTSGVRL